MTPDEAFRICRAAKALSPAQALDEYTPDSWAIVLRRVRFEDAQLALEELGGEQEWIHVSHIVQRVKRIRRYRLAAHGTTPQPPPELAGDEAAYRAWLAGTTRAIADGTWSPPSVPERILEGPTTPERRALLRAELGRTEEV